MSTFRALLVNKTDQSFTVGIESLSLDDLPEGEVTVRVAYSSVNYKDGLAAIPNGRILTRYPMIPGIDLAGTVVRSTDSRFKEGDKVIATSYDIGVSHEGGFSEYARVKADWVVPLPQGLTLKEAMALGTAGITAALSVHGLEGHGVTPDKGPVLVTGATGGVGSLAVAMLSKRGYDVVASTGKEAEHDYLRQLGAKEIIHRQELTPEKIRPLDQRRWAGAVDPVGGKTLAYVLSAMDYGGTVAVSGLTGGTEVNTTVFPFILRGVNLLGIDSVYCPMELRRMLWERLASDLKPDRLDVITTEITFDQLPQTLSQILQGKLRGRQVVRL
ncbi:putative YhdH/YhfP family quinone oxidoreductase [Caldalkalibacillus uzonensis]|uniref:YhdH/YhfP family quinone oxidoreductase n=1 Tax=Caldalkalibacillus uzonensis TaxID=353224 RepID=A0ABU0CRD2_9BACI|nr:acryloyl-CoA reductase [Caldalkalibacillus uzonensis]MDQ0338055.1 putative YhdH/YhfP family quinone oxidoreductase [Caldalkalibacillus uzonensis]